MGLGNNMSVGKAKGKSKALVRKRHKEVKEAASFVQFSHGPKKANVPEACSVNPGDMTLQGFTNNTSAGFPFVPGDYFYTKKRANPKFYIADGFYKIGPNAKGTFYSAEIVNGQVVSSPRVVTCP